MRYSEPDLSNAEMYAQLKQLLNEGKTIEMRWDCGGDEAIIYFTKESADEVKANETLAHSLELHIMNLLHLPDVGEFSMTGKGRLEMKEKNIIIIFESIMEGYADYDPESDEMEYVEVNQIEPEWTGEKVVFKPG